MVLPAKVKITLYFAGLTIAGLYMLLVLSGALFHVFWPCEFECGGRGRVVFGLALLTSPAVPTGLCLSALGRSQKQPTASRLVLAYGQRLAALFAVLVISLGLIFLFAGLSKVYSSVTGVGIAGPMNNLDYAHRMARGEGLGFITIGLFSLAVGVSTERVRKFLK